MNALLRAELIKLRTTRTFVALAGVAVATSVLIAVLVALLTEPTEDSVLVDVFASDTSSFFILVLAVIGISGEWRHRTITSSLLAAPDRLRFLAAKTIAFADGGAGAVVADRGRRRRRRASPSSRCADLPLPEIGELAGQVGPQRPAGRDARRLRRRHRRDSCATRSSPSWPCSSSCSSSSRSSSPWRRASAGSARSARCPWPPPASPPKTPGSATSSLVGTGVAVLLLLAWIAVAFAAAATLLAAP